MAIYNDPLKGGSDLSCWLRGDCTGGYSMSRSATFSDMITEEIQRSLREAALSGEFYGVNPMHMHKGEISYTSPLPSIVKTGEPVDMNDQIRNFEIKKKSTKKSIAIIYSCNFGYCRDHKYTIEFYEQDFWLAPEVVIALFPIMWRTGTGKLIFRDHKVIAITEHIKARLDKDDNRAKVGYLSYIADCMDGDEYSPCTGALIAISKLVNGSMSGTSNSKSEIKRFYKQIKDFYDGLK